jgi:hypothetical protein
METIAMPDEDDAIDKAQQTPIAHGLRVASETFHHERPDGRIAVSFRQPMDELPPAQMTTGVAARERAEGDLSPVDIGKLADGPSVWEALPDDPAEDGAGS